MYCFTPIADIRRCRWDVRKVPIADIERQAQPAGTKHQILVIAGEKFSKGPHEASWGVEQPRTLWIVACVLKSLFDVGLGG